MRMDPELERGLQDLARQFGGPQSLIDLVLSAHGNPARCAWITEEHRQCRRDLVRFFEHPAVPERRLMLCPHHAGKVGSSITTVESEGMKVFLQQRRRAKILAHERPAREQRLQQAMETAAGLGGGSTLVTYAMVRERWVKIGRTSDVVSRYRSLLMGGASMPPEMHHAAPLMLLFTLPGDCEADLHREFNAYREPRTEWFRHEGPVEEWTMAMLTAREAAPASPD